MIENEKRPVHLRVKISPYHIPLTQALFEHFHILIYLLVEHIWRIDDMSHYNRVTSSRTFT